MISYSINECHGIYRIYYRIPDKNGKLKQHSKSTGYKAQKGNKRKAEAFAREYIAGLEGLSLDNGNMLLCDYVADWVERDKARVQITTYDGYKHMLNKYIFPYFKSTRLNIRDVKPMHLEKYCADKIADGLSPNTVIKHLAVIRTALQDAVKNGIIRSNPADLVEKPKRVKPKHDFYNKAELQKLLAVSKGTSIELPVFLAIVFGLRRSEVLGLRWSAIDFENDTLTVCNKIVRGVVDGKVTDVASDTLKSDTSNRTFLMNEYVRNYLKDVRKQQLERARITNDYIDYVCVNMIGERIKADYVTHKFRDLLDAHDMRQIRFHDLRHSCISLLVNSNFNMKQVQEYAGHADFAITANTYAHIDLTVKKAEIDAITSQLV
ncbi:MAG: site-specific integrase [Oscillospiraceae bacterium]|nr:site-specific integrase [Oscillospiraceae bacterium]